MAAGDSIDSVTVTGSQTVKGTNDNIPSDAVIKNADGEIVTTSYTITYVSGELKVTEKPVTITANNDTKVYDATPLTNNGFSNTALAEDDSITATVTGSQTVVGTSANVPSAAKILNAADEDVTESYKITYANGTLEVTPKAVTITADSDNKVYDGTALTKNSFTNTDLAEGDSVTATVTGSQTVKGTSANVPSDAKIVNTDGDDVTDSYDITYVNGKLDVTKKTLEITADSDTKVYDGTALTRDSFTNTELATGDSITATVIGSRTVFGESANVPSNASITNAAGENVTASYEIAYKSGKLGITKKTLTIKADDDAKIYDGTALTNDGFTSTDLAAGDRFDSVTVTGSQTTAGTSDNVPSDAKILNAAGIDVTDSYAIDYTKGTLDVTKKAVTITADSDTKVYDGTALTKESFTNTSLADGDTINSVTVTGSRTVFGESDNVPSDAKILNADGNDVTDSYDITYVNGKLNVTKKALTITADDDTKVYDGTALTKDSFTNTFLAEGDTIDSVKVTGSQTVFGESANVPSEAVILNAAGENVTDSYDVAYVNGTLSITKKALTIKADSDSKIYDSTALTKDSYTTPALTRSTSVLAEGDAIESVTVTGSQTETGNSSNVPSNAVIRNAAGENVTESYEISYVNGGLEVIPKKVTLTANNASKTYDAGALTEGGFTASKLEGGDLHTFTVAMTEGSTITNIGTQANVIATVDGTAVTTGTETRVGNYLVTTAEGKLTVTPKNVTITANNAEKIYDGTALTEGGFTATALEAGDTHSFTVTMTGESTITETGSKANVIATVDGKDINTGIETAVGNYLVTTVNGTLTINPLDGIVVRINGNGGQFMYDAAEHKAEGFTYEILDASGLYTRADFQLTGKEAVAAATNAGTYNMGLTAADFVNVNDNFDNVTFEVTNSNLVIDPKPVTIQVSDKSKTYGDRDPVLTTEPYTLEGVDTAVITLTRETGENVGTYTISGTAARNPNYIFTVNPGTLTIGEKEITVIANDKTKVYGENDPALTATITGLVDGDSKDLIKYSLSRAAGEAAGNYTITPAGNEIQGNYKVKYETGTLKILPEGSVVVRITARNGSYLYDGTTHDLSGYTVTTNDSRYGTADFSFSGSNELSGKNAGTYRTEMKASDFRNTNPNFTNVEFEVTNGEMTIRPRAVTLTSASQTKDFDGTVLKNNKVTIGGEDGFVAGEGVTTYVTGNITKPGTVDNAFTYEANEGTLLTNYEITPIFGKLIIKDTTTGGDQPGGGGNGGNGTTRKLIVTYKYEDKSKDDVTVMIPKSIGEWAIKREKYDEGYTADIKLIYGELTGNVVASDDKANRMTIISGNMGDEDVKYEVTYKKIQTGSGTGGDGNGTGGNGGSSDDEYKLKIRFTVKGEEKDLRDPISRKMAYGDEIKVLASDEDIKALTELAGYTIVEVNEGKKMTKHEDTVVVWLLKEADGSTIIPDDPTPLGINNVTLGNGEIIE